MKDSRYTDGLRITQAILEKISRCENSHDSPNYIIMDKKSYKLFKKGTPLFKPTIPCSAMFGMKIKIIKSKDRIIVVGY